MALRMITTPKRSFNFFPRALFWNTEDLCSVSTFGCVALLYLGYHLHLITHFRHIYVSYVYLEEPGSAPGGNCRP